jgi:uncharacterized membrane protein YozB (DUF420 family)
MGHFLVVGILVIVMAVLTYVGLDAAGLMPVQASAQAVSIDWLWNWQLIAISFLFSLIVVPPQEGRDGRRRTHRRQYAARNCVDGRPAFHCFGACLHGSVFAWRNPPR